MGNWKYFQLITAFYRAFFNSIAQGIPIESAIHQVFEDFWFLPEEENILNNFICLIQYMEVNFSLNKVVKPNLVDLFYSHMEKLKPVKLDEFLDAEEIEHLKESINEIKYKIKAS
ncbi:hypothetical protein [Flagellimonas baculiformis]|uniref:hypothetical protein n=1 Tax=Flagellimonas baculiformis TaxID=3067310 RepID=UPI00296E9A11|nr:hypothetical protein [Muricauda sp. D6]